MLDRDSIKDAIFAAKELLRRKARESLLGFTACTMQTFEPAGFHRSYYNVLDDFAHGVVKKLMVWMPPQHGKSEGSTRRLPAYLMGINPDCRLAIISYSASKARKFNREIQRIIEEPVYSEIFPNTKLGRGADLYVRNADECEIVGHRGGFKTVGVGGPLTGEPVDILIMDDIYKDAKSAWSETVRSGIDDWYDSVAETRLHNESRQLLVFTRWHEDDLAGRLLREQGEYDAISNPNGWVVVKYEAIKQGVPTEYDPREEGEALWPEKHSLEQLEAIRKRNGYVFESLYQQNPRPQEGLMYERGFRTYGILPTTDKRIRKNYTDTADEGSDYLCSIDYVETEIGCFVLDVLFTTKPMEYTEQATAEMVTRDAIEYCLVESNNGGRGFCRNVEKNVRTMGNKRTSFKWFHQGENKNVRIFSHSAEVQNLIFFPEGWEHRWPEFYNQVRNYLKAGKNAHDDAPDALTGIVEHYRVEKANDNVYDIYADVDI